MSGRTAIRAMLREALNFSLTDHLLIRACEAGEAGQKEKLRGLVRPPPGGKLYGPSILVTWARKLVERRYLKPFHVGRSGGRTLTDHLFSIGLRLIGFLGSWGVPVACAIAGLVSGLAFLPLRIFTSTEVALPQILIPVFLGSIFAVWQVVNVVLYFARLLGRRAVVENHDSPDGRFGPEMLLVARRTLPPYVRWNANLAWCVFWVVVLVSTGLEYIQHHETDRDYVYHSEYMSLETRLSWLHKFSTFLPKSFCLPDESLAWGDRDFREDGYRLSPIGAQSPLSLRAEAPFLRGNDKVTLAYEPEIGQTIVGVIFTGSGLVVDQAPPFEHQTTAKQISNSLVDAISVGGESDLEQLAIQVKGKDLSFRRRGGAGRPLTFLADGVVAVTNSSEYVVSLGALPGKVEVREEGSAEGESTIVSLQRIKGGFSLARLTEPSGYTRSWFWFLFGVILTFGLAPRLAALPIFGLVYAICKWNLYRELSRDPFAAIVAELNQRPTASTIVREGSYHDGPLTQEKPSQAQSRLPHKDVLAVGYGADVTPEDVRKLGRASDFDVFGKQAGDARANVEVMTWIDRYESFGRFLVCTKLTFTPDRPLIRFLQGVVSKGVSCEIAFLDMPTKLNAIGEQMSIRMDVWRDVMGDAHLNELLPSELRNSKTERPLDDD